MLGKWLAAMTILMGMVLLPATVMAEEPDEFILVNGQNILEAENNTVQCGEGTAKYDPSSGVLTLDNAVIDTVSQTAFGVCAGNNEFGKIMDLSLNLIGKNVIQADKEKDSISGIAVQGSIDIQGEGSLYLNTDDGIYAGKGVSITDAEITLNCSNVGILAGDDIIVKDSNISAVSKTDYGIRTEGSFILESGKVYAKGGETYPALVVLQYKGAEEEAPSNTINLSEGYSEINGGKIGTTDWVQDGEGLRAFVSFVPSGENGKLAEDLSNAMKEITIDKTPAPVVKTGEWRGDNNTGRWYRYSDGSYPVSKWELIDNHWYYFNDSGYAVTGWLKQGNIWYYLNGYGTMATGWYQLGGKWYYSNSSGAMQTGWLLDGNTWYYLKGDGSMATGWYQAGGKWYYLKASGAMQTGWLKQGSIWYYLKADGAMATGWYQDGKTWYYSNGSGVMQTGWLKSGKTWYYLKASGAMQTGWLKQGRAWYYMKADGAMATGWYQDGKTWYYSNGSGVMQTGWLKQGKTWYYLKGDGAMAVGWYKTGGTWYYFKANGAMATGWNKDGNTWYYLNPSGAMAASRWIGNYYVGPSGDMYVSRYTPDGYYVDRDGVWMKLGEDDIDFDLDRVVTKYFYMRVPESWDEPAQYGAIDKMWIAMYANPFKDEDGEDDYEPLFGIVAAKTEAEAKSYMAELKNPKNLGKHSGLWFVAGQDQETEISKYPQDQQAEILQMQKDIPAILNSIVFR
jgi:glucan-binding YG repeat protein